MEVKRICKWCGKPFIAKKTTTNYCSHQCSSLGYKHRMRERRIELREIQDLIETKSKLDHQDYFTFAQAAKLMGVSRQYIYKLVKEDKLRASRLSSRMAIQELTKLNNNIHEMRIVLEKLANAVQHYEYKIASKTLKQTEDLGNGLISKLSKEMDVQYSKFEARMKEYKDEDRIRLPTRVFYISVICLVSLFCFFICTVAANIHLLNSVLLWKIFGWSIGMATIGTVTVIAVPKLMKESK